MSVPPPLIDLLGTRWTLEAPVVGVAFDGNVAGFGLGDGTLALAPSDWEGGPELRPREGGGMEVVPAVSPAPPMTTLSVHEGACLMLAADPNGGFLSGGDDGRLAHVAADGAVEEMASFPGHWADPVAAGRAGWYACAVGKQVYLLGDNTQSLELPSPVTALAFDGSGRHLAIAHYGGVTIWSIGVESPRQLTWRGGHLSLAWSPDGRYLVSGMEENVLHGWRLSDSGDMEMGGYAGQPRSLSFSADGGFLATSGGERVVCWRFDPPKSDAPPAESGIASKTPVSLVACHPVHPVIAVGYHNGAVLLCQPGMTDILFVKGSGTGPVSALAWSATGDRLAFGNQGGEAALVSLPESLFRFARRTSNANAGNSHTQRGAT